MKKTAVYVLIILCFFGIVLFITDKTSAASAASRRAIHESAAVVDKIGPVKHAILAMLSEKTGPTGKGCATLSYFVIGTTGSEWVQVRLTVERYNAPWKAKETVIGSQMVPQTSCLYG